MHVTPALAFDQICTIQMKPLQRQLNAFFNQYRIHILRQTVFLNDIKKLFNETFHLHLPSPIEERALAERSLIQSIRRKLKEDQLILRRSEDQSNLFYLLDQHQFNQQSESLLKQFNWCEQVHTIDSTHLLTTTCQAMDQQLSKLYQESHLQESQLSQLRIQSTNRQFPYLYFLPSPRGNQPFISSCRTTPIEPLANYLNQLLRPLYEKWTETTTISDSMDFLEKLARFDDYLLLPQTSFATFKILDIYHQMSHVKIIEALHRFLTHVLHPQQQYQQLSIPTIERLTDIYLKNQIFTYNRDFYRFIKGCPLSLPLTRTLANIYLHDWQGSFVGQLNYYEEFYGRYHDIVFLSWQSSLDRLQLLLDELDHQHPDIRIEDLKMGFKVQFLGIQVENQQGKLYTNVYHDPQSPRFVLPYVIGHPRLFYRQWYQWALARAIYACISIEDFDQERIYIELTMLSHGFSLDSIKSMASAFLNKYGSTRSFDDFNSRSYASLRLQSFNAIHLERTLHRQQQVTSIDLHYFYDWGSRCHFNERFKTLWLDRIQSDPAVYKVNLKLNLKTIHCYPLNALLTESKMKET